MGNVWHWDTEASSSRQVIVLTEDVADLKQKLVAQYVWIAAQDKAMAAQKGKMTHILQAF